MPRFDRVSLNEAMSKSASSKRAQILAEYAGYIQQLAEGQAGRLQAAAGERVGTLRRRLGDAAKIAGKNLTIKRTGDEIYFWLAQGRGATGRRRGRPRKA